MKKALIWILAIILTLGASFYQRMSGPTYPLNIKSIAGDDEYSVKLIRSATIGEECNVEIDETDLFDEAFVVYAKYPGEFGNDTIYMKNTSGSWSAYLPEQPSAGKLKYHIVLIKDGETIWQNDDNPAIIRFKNSVPDAILIPHVIAMLLAMLFSMVTMFMVLLKKGNSKRMSYFAVASLIIGGFILGPIMQNYAFGEFWTGWPNGGDFTDNKTLIAFIVWVFALILNIKKDRKWALVIAAISMIVVFSIPHSLGGSEFNHEKGQVETGNRK